MWSSDGNDAILWSLNIPFKRSSLNNPPDHTLSALCKVQQLGTMPPHDETTAATHTDTHTNKRQCRWEVKPRAMCMVVKRRWVIAGEQKRRPHEHSSDRWCSETRSLCAGVGTMAPHPFLFRLSQAGLDQLRDCTARAWSLLACLHVSFEDSSHRVLRDKSSVEHLYRTLNANRS